MLFDSTTALLVYYRSTTGTQRGYYFELDNKKEILVDTLQQVNNSTEQQRFSLSVLEGSSIGRLRPELPQRFFAWEYYSRHRLTEASYTANTVLVGT